MRDETSIDVGRVVSVFLANGGSTALSVNGAVTPVTFRAKPPVGKKWRIKRVLGYIEASAAFSAEKFANLTALTNGIALKINGVEIARWKTNREMAIDIGALDVPTALAKLDRAMTGELCFHKSFGNSILIDSTNGIELIVSDDLSTLVDFHVKVQGELV